jgi:hypothetical protein
MHLWPVGGQKDRFCGHLVDKVPHYNRSDPSFRLDQAIEAACTEKMGLWGCTCRIMLAGSLRKDSMKVSFLVTRCRCGLVEPLDPAAFSFPVEGTA